MGGRAAGAGPHLHGGLPHDQAIAAGDDERLDRVTQVLGRIVLGEQADRPAAAQLKPGGRIRQSGCVT